MTVLCFPLPLPSLLSPAGWMVLGMFAAHNRTRVSVSGYHYGPQPPDVTALLDVARAAGASSSSSSSSSSSTGGIVDVAAAARSLHSGGPCTSVAAVVGGAAVDLVAGVDGSGGVGSTSHTPHAGNGSVTMQLACSSDRFYSVADVTDVGIGDHMVASGVDILVDLMVLTRSARLRITAMRPAPIVVSYLGYPGTSGEWALLVHVWRLID